MMSDSIARFEAVTKYYKGQVIGVNNITAEIGRGTTGLLGPNGAGKSTMLKLMTGQIKPNTGIVRVLEHNPFSNPKVFKSLGYCPEQDSFYPWMTLYQFIETLARLRGFAKEEAKREAERVIEIVQLTELAKARKLSQASKGMRQRIKVAQALIGDPDILVLDEPLAGADPINRHEIINTISQLDQAGHHIVVSSHVLHEIESMSNHIILMYKGKLLAEGEIKSIRNLLYDKPHHVHIQTPEPRRLAALLVELEFIDSLTFNKDGSQQELVVLTTNPREFYRTIPSIVVKNRIELQALETTDDTLEAVFNYLVR